MPEAGKLGQELLQEIAHQGQNINKKEEKEHDLLQKIAHTDIRYLFLINHLWNDKQTNNMTFWSKAVTLILLL